MALNAAAKAAVVAAIISDLSTFTAAGIPDPTGAVMWNIIVSHIYDGIVSNAVVSGLGPPLTAGAVVNTVVGTVS